MKLSFEFRYLNIHFLDIMIIRSNATRDAFRRNPLEWYNNFWLNYFPPSYKYFCPNEGHEALAEIASLKHDRNGKLLQEETINNVRIITQNVDGLHCRTVHKWNHQKQLIEAHGRVGLYKCIPEEDSDTDSDSDDEEDRPVKLGSLRKHRSAQNRLRLQGESSLSSSPSPTPSGENICSQRSKPKFKRNNQHKVEARICPYEVNDSISVDKLNSSSARKTLISLELDNRVEDASDSSALRLSEPPRCPGCDRPCLPQSLLFDEGYHSHAFYKFQTMEKWIAECEILVFVGTSFSVTITDVALKHAMEHSKPVFNFNLHERLSGSARLNVENIMGDSSETLTQLSSLVQEIMKNKSH